MEEIALLTSLAMFLVVAAVCSIVFNKLKLPPLVGYLFAGIILANVLTLTEDNEAVVNMLSNMGLIMLMFSIGLEINLKKLRKQGMTAIKVALIEIPFMVLGGMIFGGLFSLTSFQSLCLGAVMAGSSTAVVLGVLKMQNRLEKDRIDTLILVIIMEDISQVIILSMLTPMMVGSAMDPGALAAMIVSIIVFMVVSLLIGIRFMPRIINWISDNVSSEVLVIFAVGLAFGMAFLANFVGLSVAIGAFLMGMMIAASRRSKDILHDIEPMKNIFMAMFFISVGMEIAVSTLVDNILLTLGLLVLFIALKITAVFLGYWLANNNPKSSLESAISFLAMGEFAFIIAKEALDYGVFSEGVYTSIVGAALLSMLVLPLISNNAGDRWDSTKRVIPWPILRFLGRIDYTKVMFYSKLNLSNRKTKNEITSTITVAYLYIVLIAVIQIIFLIVSPFITEWGLKYFGADRILWDILILLMNLFLLYGPTLKLFTHLKYIAKMAEMSNPHASIRHGKSGLSILDMFMLTSTWVTAFMVDITILIFVPNGLELWEHIVVLVIALVILFYYNRKTLTMKSEFLMTAIEREDEEMDLETFNRIIQSKMDKKKQEADRTVVSIDTGDFSNK